MQKISRQIFTEIIWLVLSLGSAMVLTWLIFGWSFHQETIDIHLHDTMLVIYCGHIIALFALIIIFLSYSIRLIRQSFSKNLLNYIHLASGLALVLMLTVVYLFFSTLAPGWTEYPALEALDVSDFPEKPDDSLSMYLMNSALITQALIIGTMVFVSYKWGRARRNKLDT